MRIYSAATKRRAVRDLNLSQKDKDELLISGRSFQREQPVLIEREESLASEESIIDYSNTDDVFVAVQELSKELKAMAKSADRKCSRLEYDTINAFFRKAQDDHIHPPKHIREAIMHRSVKYMTQTRPNIDVYQLLHDGFDISGLIPGLTPQQQLEILKVKERLILIDRWEEAWNRVRCPKSAWYSMSSKEFSFELQRHNALLKKKL